MTRAKLNLERGIVRIRTLVVILIAVVLLVGGWIAFSQYRTNVANSPRTAADKVIALLTDKNSTDSYTLLSKNYRASTTKEDWKAWVDVAFTGITDKPSFVREFPIQKAGDIYGKNTTPVRYVYAFTIKGKTYNVPFVFIQEGGAWKLAEIGSPL